MREKYVDEAVGLYFPFGVNFRGEVDVNDGRRDVFEALPLDKARAVCDAQSEFRAKLYEILCKETA